MKKVVAYINTLRVHWVVDELLMVGIDDISVYQHFKPLSQISRLELKCDSDKVEAVNGIIRTVGTNGNVSDQLVEIYDL